MTLYLWIKLIHILGATVLFGTGIGTAFFMFKAYLSKNDEAMAVTTQNVVVADWLFTTPAIDMVHRSYFPLCFCRLLLDTRGLDSNSNQRSDRC
jgi:uncharacterized membrane protein